MSLIYSRRDLRLLERSSPFLCRAHGKHSLGTTARPCEDDGEGYEQEPQDARAVPALRVRENAGNPGIEQDPANHQHRKTDHGGS
jgi:hypothetical protein